MILDWSYNNHANNMYQQVAPIEIYVKTKQKRKKLKSALFAVNKQYICVCIHTDN